jgi:hypothetical protein
MPPSALNLLVFRETRRLAPGAELKGTFIPELTDLPVKPLHDRVMAALLSAGALECAVADAAEDLTRAFALVSDRLAEALLHRGSSLDIVALTKCLSDAAVPDEVSVSPPEGFAYYALHPLAFAEALEQIPTPADSVLVVGIRSIGTTLSAVTAAAARKRGMRARRITVRPVGHPYNRRVQFSAKQLDLIRRAASSGAAFVVVDEGPGLSGSSFLSVAEALEQAGARRETITLICGHEPDFDSLRADNGPGRGRRFRWIAASSPPRRPTGADLFVGGGEWRKHLLPDEPMWPACWTSLERLKYLSAGSDANAKLFKFLGFGHYGEEVFEREEQVAAAGFGPHPHRASEGFASCDWLSGRPMSAGDLSEPVLKRLAEYCAFRAQDFATNIADVSAVEQMAEHNLCELGIDLPVALQIERPAVCDGHMQPHEWLLTSDGRMLKTDSGSHGDDHFFPGPTDIAWDLTGAIVEWGMNAPQTEFFLKSYRRASGDDARCRIADFITAYTVFRCAYSLMAANAQPETGEQTRLERAANEYRAALLSYASAGYLLSVSDSLLQTTPPI